MTTKEKIVDEALSLFSVKGYKGTSMINIAEAVGIKDSSVYKHFRSKQEIWDTIVMEMGRRMEHLSETFGFPDGSNLDSAAEIYGTLSLEELLGLSKKIFLFYLKDDFVSRFWRMANIEQYQNPEIYEIYRHIFMEESITYQTALFGQMIKKGIFIEADPSVVAMNFYTPIFFLLSKYSGRPAEERVATQILEKQVKEFYRIYRKK